MFVAFIVIWNKHLLLHSQAEWVLQADVVGVCLIYESRLEARALCKSWAGVHKQSVSGVLWRSSFQKKRLT
jgi:hypothetical protein